MASKRKFNQRSLDSFFTPPSVAKRPATLLDADIPGSNAGTITVEAVVNQVARCNNEDIEVVPSAPSPPVAYAKDIGLYVGRALSQEEKIDILQNAWQPDIKFKFPSSGVRNLKFQSSWLRDHEWLRYSASEDGAFCLWCALFSADVGCGKGGHEQAGQLVNAKFCKWKHAKEIFKKHQNSKFHDNSRVTAASFLAVAVGKNKPITAQIDSALQREVDENRKNLKPIIETVLFCGREGLPLRGSDESGEIRSSTETGGVTNKSGGKFRALLRFKLDSNDTVLAKHLNTAASNAKYTSPEIQNGLIDCCKNIVTKHLVEEINAAKGFSVLADETTDASKKEQLVICIRYLKGNEIKEAFLIFVTVTDLKGIALADVILNTLVSLGIDITYMFGQGYDGASSMSSRFQGVQAHVRAKNPLAIYVHCSSHSFNLAISDACGIPAITNCMAVISAAYDFFRYPKRNNELLKAIDELKPESGATRLKKQCATRWIDRHESAITTQELLGPINRALENIISTWTDRDTISSATSLQRSILDGGFLVTLHVVTELFAVSLPLSRQLQTKNMDLAEAMSLADSAQCALQKMRDEAEQHFHTIFTRAEQVAAGLDVSVEIPRRCGRQLYRVNTPASTPEEYFRVGVFIPFLDSFIVQMNERLLAHRNLLTCFSSLLPSKEACKNGFDSDASRQSGILHSTYSKHLDCGEVEFQGEMKLYYQHLSKLEAPPRNALDALQVCSEYIFPSVRRMLEILCVLPVTTATAERAFSTLRYLKNYLRSCCAQSRLNGLTHLYIHQDVVCTPEMVLDEFAKKSRRLRLKL